MKNEERTIKNEEWTVSGAVILIFFWVNPRSTAWDEGAFEVHDRAGRSHPGCVPKLLQRLAGFEALGDTRTEVIHSFLSPARKCPTEMTIQKRVAAILAGDKGGGATCPLQEVWPLGAVSCPLGTFQIPYSFSKRGLRAHPQGTRRPLACVPWEKWLPTTLLVGTDNDAGYGT